MTTLYEGKEKQLDREAVSGKDVLGLLKIEYICRDILPKVGRGVKEIKIGGFIDYFEVGMKESFSMCLMNFFSW